MKKFIFSGLALCAFAFNGISQIPTCQNEGALEGRISGIEASGWKEVSREFVYINYFVEPTPPYQLGYLVVGFVPDCDPLEPCPQIAKAYVEDAFQQSQSTCLWKPAKL